MEFGEGNEMWKSKTFQSLYLPVCSMLTSFEALKKIIVIQCFKMRKRLLSEGFMLHIKWTTWKKAFKLTNSINFTLTSLPLFRSTKTHGDTEEKRTRERDKNQTWRSTLNSFSFLYFFRYLPFKSLLIKILVSVCGQQWVCPRHVVSVAEGMMDITHFIQFIPPAVSVAGPCWELPGPGSAAL